MGNYETHYTTDDLTEETLEPYPALRALVGRIEARGGIVTTDEAILINVIARQQNALAALARDLVQHRPGRDN